MENIDITIKTLKLVKLFIDFFKNLRVKNKKLYYFDL